jgi:hypothetical protein
MAQTMAFPKPEFSRGQVNRAGEIPRATVAQRLKRFPSKI